jgi:peptide deformylase
MDRHVSDLARDMVDLMHRHEGIGLAAPQVGLLVRLIVADIGEGLLGIVNPQVMPVTDVKDSMNEGCLSLPDVSVEIDRKQAVEVRGMDPTGGPLHFEARGLLARVIQHEVDHLEGILICDYATAPGERPQGITQRSRPAPMDKRA